tara:strand:+ start:53 stop:277 length:225 start_codon:yes stop_codon:yes gene_type:complete
MVKEKQEERKVIEALLNLSEIMMSNMRLEIANVLHQLGWCQELITPNEDGTNNCPICKMEEARENAESGDNESD